jgi:hypothetical protein
MMRQKWFCVLVLLIGISTAAAQAESTPPIIFAGVQNRQLSVFIYDPDAGDLEIERLLTHPSVEEFDNLSWSPEGLILSFTQRIDPHLELEPLREELIFAPYLPEHQPYVVETSLSRNLQLFFAPQFDAKGYLTYVVRPLEDVIYQDADLQGVLLDVYQRTQYPGPLPQRIGQIVYGYGCGHTPSSPMEALQDAEGALDSVVMATPHGIVFSPFCAGRGLALSTEDQFTLLHDNLRLIAVAPDRETLAGWDGSTGTVVRYDLATRAATECPVESEVTQVAWALDGSSLFYSTRYPAGEFEFAPIDTAALNEVIDLSESLMVRYGVRLYRLAPETCISELLYDNPDAYAISRILPLAERVLFSEIENGEAWFAQLLTDGERDFTREWSTRDIVTLTLYDLPFGGEAHVIGRGIEKVAVRGS